jgi:hypothetical protein
MQKKYLLLSLTTSVAAAGAAFALSISNSASFLSTASTGTQWNHYEAVSATCDKYGIKEYWTDCKGNTTIIEPIEGQMIEKGQPSAEDIQYIVDTYGVGDERIVAKVAHNFVDTVVASKIGYFGTACSVCGEAGELSANVMQFADIDFTKATYGAQGGAWGSDFPVTGSGVFKAEKWLKYEITAANAEEQFYFPKINFALFDVVQFSVSCDSWAIEAGLVSGSYVLPFCADFSEDHSTGTLKFVKNAGNVIATLTCNETSQSQQVTITDQDIIDGNKSFGLYANSKYQWQTVTIEITALTDECEHNYVADPNCIGKEVCSICGEARAVAPSIDFATNGIYGMYDWYTSFGAPAEDWVFNVEANSIHFYTYNSGVYSEVCLPRMYFAGFSAVTIDFTIANASEKYSFNSDLSDYYTVPSASFAAKLVFYNITSSSMVASLRDSSNNILLSKVVTDENVLNGVDGFKFYDEGVGLGNEHLSNFAFVGEHAHNYVADAGCIGKEACSVCYAEHGVANPSFDFSSNLYGAYDYYEGGVGGAATIDPSWVVANGASEIKFVNAFNDGSIFDYHLPKIYFANFSSVTINLVINYASEVFALENGFSQSFTAPFSNYDHAQLVFENISSSNMTVKLNDAFGTTYAQVTCSNADVLNGDAGFVLYAKGSGNIAFDALNNFTFVA